MSELKKLTKLGGDVRRIAALLQAKAPKGEMLAFINPREAAILKAHGGSGEIDPETGIPSFQPVDGEGLDFETQAVDESAQPAATSEAVSAAPTLSGPTVPFGGPAEYQPPVRAETQPTFDVEAAKQGMFARPAYPEYTPPVPSATGQAAQEQTLEQRLKALEQGINKYPGLTRTLTGAGFGLAGALAGRQGAQQAEGMRQEISGIGQQYSKMGQDLLAKAQRGELTPAQQQQMQAFQAQLAQGVQARGGVGVQQAQQQLTAFVNQLTQNNITEAMQYINLGDQYQMQAIKAGYSANQDAQNAAMRFYSAMGSYLAPGSQGTPIARTPGVPPA